MNEFRNFMTPCRKGHLIGIGGVSMSPLAEVLRGMGLIITGSDISDSDKVQHLRTLGIEIHIGHRAENLARDTEFVVRTAAAHDDNPEVVEAHRRGIPVFERAQAWGAIMQDYDNALCIAGTHGKTTTTSMCTHILMAAEKDPTVMIGGTLPLLESAGYRVGRGNTIILESCEYYNSFLQFFPTVAIITNIEADHLDFFRDIEDIKHSFREFASHVPQETGHVIVNLDDKNSMDAIRGLQRHIVTYGMGAEADVYPENISSIGFQSTFDVMYRGNLFANVTIHVPGRHNIYNALAATAAAICLGIKPTAVTYGLAGFNGAGRRLEFKGKFNGADVYDDYAHHPGELKALLDAVEPLGYKRTIVVFQPHTYSRTIALFDDFLRQLSRPDVVYLAEIYAAREKNTQGVSSAMLAEKLPNATFFPSFSEIGTALRAAAQPGDILLTVGAGDVYRIGEDLVKK
ncbi:MAG TPA: UDP-N-acetylmuramate--L-alanine ligase [Oscillospiraceae bacterium]|nr:UDP-N-acetylmuramate--L-alanine ligase [Oscillospiraceae bacterium]